MEVWYDEFCTVSITYDQIYIVKNHEGVTLCILLIHENTNKAGLKHLIFKILFFMISFFLIL